MCHMSASKGYIMEAKESLWQAPHLTAGPAATECLQFCCPAALPHSSHNWHRMQLRGSGGKEFHLLFPGSFHWLLSSLLFFQSTPTPIVNLRTHLRAAISTIPFCTMGPAPLFQLCWVLADGPSASFSLLPSPPPRSSHPIQSLSLLITGNSETEKWTTSEVPL